MVARVGWSIRAAGFALYVGYKTLIDNLSG